MSKNLLVEENLFQCSEKFIDCKEVIIVDYISYIVGGAISICSFAVGCLIASILFYISNKNK